MKVLQVLPALDTGGVERGTLDIARALVQAGHSSSVLSGGGRMVSRLQKQGSDHVLWSLGKKSPLSLRHVRPLRRWLASQHFDILHLRSRMPGWLCWLAWRGMDPATRPRLVTTVHGMHSVSRYSEIVTCGERIIVVSESIRDYVLENYPRCDPDKLRLIYRGINPLEFPRGHQPAEQWLSDWYREFPQLLDQRVVTMAGRLTRLKGHHDFVDVIEQLRKTGQPVHGLIVGGEDPKRIAYAREIYQAVKERGLEEHLTFAGHRGDLRDIYAVSDVVLSLSTQPESFGRTVLEPLSEGRPVVGYDHGGVAEILSALYPRGAVPVRDTAAAATQVAAILSGQVAPPRRNTQFLLDVMARDTLSVYEELLSAPRAL
ncbi:glycosyltransferase family 4 protein [Congregibacter litoralis]|uniref:Glycosyltransferase n=1 Tax=Congregibacter litoralis KT71 TaxID=314285 RepID=A4AA79_9GAMM|nr:glycosyltransferase family 4 protein [Congregibacter litoralis]EAQ96956.1 Glycosyltransferase [Congregibacter litoralis KT71]